jgi:hypothetical protein
VIFSHSRWTKSTRSGHGGILKNPDQMIYKKVQEELEDKCGKTYSGTYETWLCINQDAAVSDAKSVGECVNKLEIPPGTNSIESI